MDEHLLPVGDDGLSIGGRLVVAGAILQILFVAGWLIVLRGCYV